MIGQKSRGRDLVPVLAALLTHAGETVANLNALDRIDAHQRMGDIRVEAVEYRLSPTRRDAGRSDRDTGADGVTVLGEWLHEGFHNRHLSGSGQKKRVVVDFLPHHTAHRDRTQLA